MNNLFDFILRYISWFVFLICEIISLVLLFTYNNYQGSIWMSSANVVTGKVYEVNAGVEQFFSLTDINEQLSKRNLYLEQRVQDLTSQIAAKTGDSALMKLENYELMKKFNLISAKVVSNSISKRDNLITIDKGEADGVRVILTAGERKSVQFQAGFRYDSEEYAAVQLGLDIPFKTAVPMSTDITVRLGKRLKTRAELTIHPRSFTRPTLSYEFRRNDVDVFLEGDRAYNVLFNQFQGELIPFNNDFRHFNIQLGLRWDYMHYRDALVAESSRRVTLKNEHFFSYLARLNYNSEDNWYFPTRGARFKAEYNERR